MLCILENFMVERGEDKHKDKGEDKGKDEGKGKDKGEDEGKTFVNMFARMTETIKLMSYSRYCIPFRILENEC
jgi:hypothetical protein